VLGARLLLEGAVPLAEMWGVSDAVIGAIVLGVVAVSVPWLTGRWRFGRRAGFAFLAGHVLFIAITTGALG